MKNKLLDLIREWAERNHYVLLARGKNPQAFIVGESHRDPKLIAEQGELVDIVKPGFILHELMETLIYAPKTKELKLAPGRAYNSYDADAHSRILDYAVNWADKHQASLIGCDLSMQEMNNCFKEIAKRYPKKYHYDEESDEVYPIEGSLKSTNQESRIFSFREAQMGKTILEYAKRSSKPVVAVVGAYHIRPRAKIHAVMKKADYWCIDQTSIV